MELTFLGAAGTVTGSCTLLSHNATKILIDCGTRQGDQQGSTLHLPCHPRELTAILLTHGHLDHSGHVPVLVAGGFVGKIYAHKATGEIAEIIWNDSVRLQGDFDGQTVHQTKALLSLHSYNQPFSINDLSITLFDAGHILGSSHILIAAGGKRVLFSGDIGVVNTPILRNPTTQWEKPVDAVIIESTYGNRTHKDRWDTIIEFGAIVKKTIAERGVLLIPAFAIGRTQEILYHLNSLVEAGTIPKIPVLVDSPMAARITAIYSEHEECYDAMTRAQLLSGDLPLTFPGLHVVDSVRESATLAAMRPPLIIIAGSGMCNGGRIVAHLAAFLPVPSTTVMIVGWQSRESIGRQLLDGKKEVEIYGEKIAVKARTVSLNGFSAHADEQGLCNWARAVSGDDILWLINHGEVEAAQGLARRLGEVGLKKAKVVALGERVVVG